MTNVKEMYENELKEARNLLDEVAKEKAQLQVENGAARDNADAEKTRYLSTFFVVVADAL